MRSALVMGLTLMAGCVSDIGSSATGRGDEGGTVVGSDAGTPSAPPSRGGTAPDGKPRVSGGCRITGCNDQICSDHLVETDCTPTAQDACFRSAICERGDTGACRWTSTTELTACLAGAAGMAPPDPGSRAGMRGSGSGIASDGGVPPSGGGSGGSGGGSGGGTAPGTGECRQTGCFGELCSDRDVEGGACEWQNAYACYYATSCERQNDGRCGWTPTDWLDTCIELSGFGGGFGGFGF